MNKEEKYQLILKLSNEGKSNTQVADYLNQNKIPTLSGKPGAKWQQGTISNILARLRKAKKSETAKKTKPKTKPKASNKPVKSAVPMPAPDLEEQLKNARAANKDILKELDATKALLAKANVALKKNNAALKKKKTKLSKALDIIEVNEINLTKAKLVIQKQDADINALEDTVTHLKQELSSRNEREKQVETTQLDINEAIAPLVSKIDSLETMLKGTVIKPVKPGVQTETKTRKTGKLAVYGFIIRQSSGYYKGFRYIKGTKRGVHLGKEFDLEKAKAKIIDTLNKNADKWGLSEQDIEAIKQEGKQEENINTVSINIKKEQTETKPETIKDIIFKLNPKGRFVSIAKCREQYQGTDFDEQIRLLAKGQIIELHQGGASGLMPESEYKGAYHDQAGNRYLTISWLMFNSDMQPVGNLPVTDDITTDEAIEMIRTVAYSEGIEADIKIISRYDDKFISVEAGPGRWEFKIKDSVKATAIKATDFLTSDNFKRLTQR